MKRTFLYLLTVIFSIITGLSIPAQAYDIFQELNKVDNAAGKQYLHADEAFIVSIDNQADHSSVSIDIAPDYYLYRHLFKVSINRGKAVISNLPDGSFQMSLWVTARYFSIMWTLIFYIPILKKTVQ